jgi:metal-sulfur cluster biosynthetic enzyme
MRDDVPCEFPAGYDGSAIIERLAQVLDPELDEPILDLGFVRSLELRSGHACVALRLPTSWCAVNFAYLMAEDVRRALLGVEGIRQATVRLGDHCAAEEIETAVNGGRPFAEAFPGEGAGSLAALRLTFLRKGFLGRQERLLREMRDASCSAAALCALRLGEVSTRDDRDCDPAARRCIGRERIGRDLAALFGASSRTRPRLQPRRTADRRPRRQGVLRGPATSPL